MREEGEWVGRQREQDGGGEKRYLGGKHGVSIPSFVRIAWAVQQEDCGWWRESPPVTVVHTSLRHKPIFYYRKTSLRVRG